jgi:hypothetical protein
VSCVLNYGIVCREGLPDSLALPAVLISGLEKHVQRTLRKSEQQKMGGKALRFEEFWN